MNLLNLLNNFYENIAGRTILIILLIYLALKNKILALLVLGAIVISVNAFSSFSFLEGLENIEPLTNKAKGKIAKEKGIDKEDIKTAIAAKNSKTIIPPPNTSSDDVVAAEPTILTSEGFCSSCEHI